MYEGLVPCCKIVHESCIFNGCKTCRETHANTCRLICYQKRFINLIWSNYTSQLLPYNSANSVVPGNEASVTLNVHVVVFRYMYTQSLSAGSLYMACVSETRACSKIAQGNLNIFHRR